MTGTTLLQRSRRMSNRHTKPGLEFEEGRCLDWRVQTGRVSKQIRD